MTQGCAPAVLNCVVSRSPSSSRVPKWLKFLIAIPLLPVCAGAATALWRVLRAGGGADTVFIPLLAGAACWLVVFLLLPRPMWIYVAGHELTHAVWTWLFGGRVKRMKVTSQGGHVIITKSNFVIALAPYFFPFYAALVALMFTAGHLIWDWRAYAPWFHLLLGAAYAFHVTLTWHVLQTRQSDITEHGYFFSGVVIFLGNALTLLLALPALMATPGVLTALGWWLRDTGAVFVWLGQWLR
jgi:hypothetical protein